MKLSDNTALGYKLSYTAESTCFTGISKPNGSKIILYLFTLPPLFPSHPNLTTLGFPEFCFTVKWHHLPSHHGRHLSHPKLHLLLHPPIWLATNSCRLSLNNKYPFSPLLLLRPQFRPSSLLPEHLRQSTSFLILPPCKPGHALPRPLPPGRMLSGPQLQPACQPACVFNPASDFLHLNRSHCFHILLSLLEYPSRSYLPRENLFMF